MIVWRGYGILGLLLLGIASYLVEKFGPEYSASLEMSKLSQTLFLGAILMIPFSVWDFLRYRKEKRVAHSIFFVPVFVFPIVLAFLGYVYITYKK
tara:strand:- start:63256 stop:63540 length:285 start_codon:yes stop_codon:yes gene_type:complete